MHYLQNRWKLEGKKLYYYGLRNRKDMFRNSISISAKQREVIAALPKDLNGRERKILKNLLGKQVVTENRLKKTPTKLSDARFCTSCCANDFIIPGLEFDENGLCPMCQTEKTAERLKSILPIVHTIPRSPKSRFDVALFYTGGKDSTFLLYYLAKVKKLRVLALTWEIPCLSDSAKASIEGAKKSFRTVEFISRTVCRDDLDKIYKALFSINGNTCACPSLAYLLFYPELAENRVPYFLAGNEPVQMLRLYYNHIAPKIAYSFAKSRILTALYNLGRIFTLHPPLRQGQIQTLLTMKQLAYGDNFIKRHSGFLGEPTNGVVKAIHSLPEMLPTLKRSIRRSSRTGNVPAFVHLDFDAICGGKYDWNRVKETLQRECGWVAPNDANKALHTSCRLEKCKDYSQFLRFYRCQSKMIPFSALEISLSSKRCGRAKDDIIQEMEHSLGLSLEEPPEYAALRAAFEQNDG